MELKQVKREQSSILKYQNSSCYSQENLIFLIFFVEKKGNSKVLTNNIYRG